MVGEGQVHFSQFILKGRSKKNFSLQSLFFLGKSFLILTVSLLSESGDQTSCPWWKGGRKSLTHHSSLFYFPFVTVGNYKISKRQGLIFHSYCLHLLIF